MAGIGFVTTALVVQVGTMLTGILGVNYIFTIFLAIQTSFSLLMYKGKRWRFLIQIILFTFLIFPTYVGGVPFDLLSKINLPINAFFGDIIFNSIYGLFEKKDKLLIWSILITVIFWVLNPFFGLVVKSFYLTPEAISKFADVILMLLPVIIIEAVAGGYLGYKIFKRTKKLHYS
jgi:hypothetical protein